MLPGDARAVTGPQWQNIGHPPRHAGVVLLRKQGFTALPRGKMCLQGHAKLWVSHSLSTNTTYSCIAMSSSTVERGGV